MKILISGASGFIGSQLSSHLKSVGHSITPLSRDFSENLEGYDAVIHLGGENISTERWSAKKKKRIFDSRVLSTRLLVSKLNALKNRPKLFICASAVGCYGDRADELLDESSSFGSGFLADLTRKWEYEASLFKGRTLNTRFGLVLDPKGGALAKMALPFKFYLGAVLGTGKEWVSWITLEDLVLNFDRIIKDASFNGPINFTAPNPITQREFARALAKCLKSPLFFRIPRPLLRLILGEVVDGAILTSLRVHSNKLNNFKYPNIEEALGALFSIK